MDGLSAAASIIAVIDLAAKAATTIYSYSVSAKDCPDSVQHLQRELNAVKGILNELKTLAERLDRERCEAKPDLLSSHLFGEDEELAQCQKTVQQLLDGLEGDWRVKLEKEWRVKLGRRLRWPIEEKNIMSFITQLERYKATFSLSLLADSMCVSRRCPLHCDSLSLIYQYLELWLPRPKPPWKRYIRTFVRPACVCTNRISQFLASN